MRGVMVLADHTLQVACRLYKSIPFCCRMDSCLRVKRISILLPILIVSPDTPQSRPIARTSRLILLSYHT